MKVALLYGVVTGGGCERRMGDICRWLNDNGDEAHIIASMFDGLGEAVLHGQCGVPMDRVHYFHSPGTFDKHDGNWGKFVYATLADLGVDLVDVQWFLDGMPPAFPCCSVATVHGAVPPPPATLVQAVISVEESEGLRRWYDHTHPRVKVRVVQNWVNLRRYPYREELGEGLVFVGRSFKMGNIRKIAPYYAPAVIEAYGTSHSHMADLPANVNWHGFVDPVTVLYQHRVLFASAQCALEGLAAGRLVIAGQNLHLPPDSMPNVYPDGRLVTPDNVESMVGDGMQFSYVVGREPTPEEVWYDTQKALLYDFTKQRRELRRRVERMHNIDTQIAMVRDVYREVVG